MGYSDFPKLVVIRDRVIFVEGLREDVFGAEGSRLHDKHSDGKGGELDSKSLTHN